MAGKGGKTVGSGRKKGVPDKERQELIAQIEATGKTPLEVMIENMRRADAHASAIEGVDAEAARKLRAIAQDAAKDAAPYIHPKFQATRLTGPDSAPIHSEIIVRFVGSDGTIRDYLR